MMGNAQFVGDCDCEYIAFDEASCTPICYYDVNTASESDWGAIAIGLAG